MQNAGEAKMKRAQSWRRASIDVGGRLRDRAEGIISTISIIGL